MPDADLSLAVPAVFFGSVGTAGQRCTSTRRLYLHRAIAPEFLARLQTLYTSPILKPGDPLDPRTLLGPLHSRAALDTFDRAIAELEAAGAHILVGSPGRYDDEKNLRPPPPPLHNGNFVRPTIAIPNPNPTSTAKFKSKSKSTSTTSSEEAKKANLLLSGRGRGPLWETERFAPILCVAEFDELEEAIAMNNAVPQGLSSSLWTRDVRHVGKWIGPAGSDAGIVNVSVFFFVFLFFFFCEIFSPCVDARPRSNDSFFPLWLVGGLSF